MYSDVKVENLEHPKVQELLNKFKKRNELNVIEVAEIVYKLITTLKVDHEKGRHKEYSISVCHLGDTLGIGKGVVSQYMSVWNMPQESKDFLINYDLSLIESYEVSRIKGKDESEKIKLQKEKILSYNRFTGYGKKSDFLYGAIIQAKMIVNSITTSQNVPKELIEEIPVFDLETKVNKVENMRKIAKIILNNINNSINYLSPKISNLGYLQKELEFCKIMLENNIASFCGMEITRICIEKQINFISEEINYIELEYKKSHIASLLMMKNELEKNL